MIANCVQCERPLKGRQTRFCSVRCERDTRNERNRERRTVDDILEELRSEGEDSIRLRVAYDLEFADWLRDLADSTLSEPLPEPTPGQERHSKVLKDTSKTRWRVGNREALTLINPNDRRFQVVDLSKFHLPGDTDIDQAEESGDWSEMLARTLSDMTWQFANGYIPDLRGYDVPHIWESNHNFD